MHVKHQDDVKAAARTSLLDWLQRWANSWIVRAIKSREEAIRAATDAEVRAEMLETCANELLAELARLRAETGESK